MNSSAIQVAIADDHRAVLQSFTFYLSMHPDIKVILEAEDGHVLLRELAHCRPDVLLLDVNMPGLSGIETLKIVSETYPAIKVLMLSAFTDEVYIAQCLKYGIYGYLPKTMDLGEIVTAIKKCYENEPYFQNLVHNQLLKSYLLQHQKRVDDTLPHFSDGEIRILTLIKEEKTTEEISSLMHLSKRSIELKREKMKLKAQKKTVAGLILYAFKRGLLD